MTITEIANSLSRKAGLIQSGLTELAQVDLVGRRDKTYFINDSLLRLWIYFKFYHPEGAFSLQDQVIQELTTQFREKIIRCDIVGC